MHSAMTETIKLIKVTMFTPFRIGFRYQKNFYRRILWDFEGGLGRSPMVKKEKYFKVG